VLAAASVLSVLLSQVIISKTKSLLSHQKHSVNYSQEEL
jgi:hypothetical protein